MNCKHCHREAKRIGLCWTHYQRMRTHGSPHVKYKQGIKVLEVGFSPTDGIPWKATGEFSEWAYGR